MRPEDSPAAEGRTLPGTPAARRAEEAGPDAAGDPSTLGLESAPPATAPALDDDTLPIADLTDDGAVAAMFRAAGFTERYRRGEILGTGGMGEVRALADRATGRVVAMKTIRRDRELEGLRRFAREARIQAQLEHPAVVPVYDVGLDADGAFYFTMKRVRGDSLAQVLVRLRAGDAETARRYTLRKLLTVLSSVAMTIEYAHRRGVVHRDLKPSNVMLGAFGEVYVLDWGLADVRSATPSPPAPLGFSPSKAGIPLPAADVPLLDSSLRPDTETGAVLGTPGYAAPEQIQDPRGTDHRVDLYALGVMLFEILTLERLHTGATVPDVFGSTLSLDGARARDRAPARDVPPELDALAHDATRRDPSRRPPSAAAFARYLEAYLDGDRDVETRRRLAAQGAEAAAAALVTAHAPGADETAARTVALREVTTALGLDPSNARARALLVRLLTEPSASTVVAAETAHHDDAVASYRLAARNAIFALLTYALYIPLVLWMGIRHWWMLGAMTASIAAVIAVTYHYYRHPPRDLRLPLPHLIASTVAMGAGVVLFGPLVLLPAIVIANGVAYIASVSHRGKAVMIATVGVVIVPVALQVVGAVPPWYSFDPQGLHVIPWMTDFPPAATLTFLAVTHAVVITACLLFVSHLRRNYLTAERRLRVQAWQLAQLVPPDARPPIA